MESDFSALRRFVRPRMPVERCDLCSAEVGVSHSHLIEPATRRIHCACEPCAILFSNQSQERFQRIPRKASLLIDFDFSDAQWESLRLPIQLVFFFQSSQEDRIIALYPSPAGATESTLPLEAWDGIVRSNPILDRMRPDVEALLVNRIGRRRDHFIAPIDECFKLVGLIRSNWHGLSGGREAWSAIDNFFGDLKSNSSEVVREVVDAA